jgi:tetratricopeptide (TPR) repeat protein
LAKRLGDGPRKLLLATILLLSGVFIGCRPRAAEVTEQPTAATAGHRRMVDLLELLHYKSQQDNPFLGDNGLRELQQALAALPPHAAMRKFELNGVLGESLLRLGESEQAIEHFNAAIELLPQLRPPQSDQLPPGIKEQIRFQLAVAWLRLGETENCVHCQTGDSCILPIRSGGVHRDQKGSTEAIDHLLKLLEGNPSHAGAKWLLNIAYMTVDGYPDEVPKEFLVPTSRFSSDEQFPRFTNISTKLNLDTVSLCGGAVAEDLDGDHWLDIVASSYGTAAQLRVFRNNGDGTFTKRIGEANLGGIAGGLNMVQADYDNDGDTDIFVLRGAWWGEHGRFPNSLLQNDGNGRFSDVTFSAGLGDERYPTQTAAWSDFDNDGDLDLFVGNEDFPCQLYRNDGTGRFQDIATQAGVTQGGFAKAVVWGDYDNDRDPDLYISSQAGHNRLYRNNGDSTFAEVAAKLDVQRPHKSFPAWFWDFNNDGALDLYVASYQFGVDYLAKDFFRVPHGTDSDCLYQGDGQGGFRDVGSEQGLVRVTQPMGSNFGDLDNDGFLDFYLGTGYPQYEGLMPNLMFRNRGGDGFSDVTYSGGFGHLQKGHGVVFADFDHDGDQDVFIEMGGALAGDAFRDVFFENPGFGNHWFKIKLRGVQSNRSAIGARIKMVFNDNGESREVYKWVNSGGSFGCNPLRQEIGLGKAERIDLLEVYWPTSDTTQSFRDLEVDQLVEVTEGKPTYEKIPLQAIKF